MTQVETPAPTLDAVYAALKQTDAEWLENTLLERWRCGKTPPRQHAHADKSNTGYLGPFDVTAPDYLVNHGASDHLVRLRTHDWSSTALGPISSWSLELRTVVNLCMRAPSSVAVWWGPDRLCLHNEAYGGVLGKRKAWALGRPIWEVWSDKDPAIERLLDALKEAETTGQPTFGADTCFHVQRNEFVEELWASWALIPIPGPSGNVGYYNPVTERTQEVLYERRMATLMALEHNTLQVDDISTLWKRVLTSLESNHADVPFAALYSLLSSRSRAANPEPSQWSSDSASLMSRSSSSASTCNDWVLEGTLEHASNQLGLPSIMDESLGSETLGPRFSKAIETKSMQTLRTDDGTFPAALSAKALSRQWGDQCRAALIIPVPQRRKTSHRAFLLLGLNPRSIYDQAMSKWISLLISQLGRSMDSVSLAVEDAWSSEMRSRLDTQEREILNEKLQLTQLEARDRTIRFRRMADMALVGMFELDAEGKLKYANNTWYEMTAFPKGDLRDVPPFAWTTVIHEDDREFFASQWAKLVDGQTLRFELRFSKPYLTDDFMDGQRLEGTTWVAAAAYSERDLHGNITNILGSLVDISRHKWMEKFQERRTSEALELKRQQEAFMDMTSHEARNPLAAISLCGESIVETCEKILDASRDQVLISRDTVATTLESASTIMACVAHQKTIIDDVLMMSKLNSGLLQISPAKARPMEEVHEVLKMLEVEHQQADIEADLVVDESYHALNIDQVLLDPVRLRQILINLLTNAIKFTKEAAVRHITVSLAASKEPPSRSIHGVEYLAETFRPIRPAIAAGPDQDTIYLMMAVKDSGCGIDESELTHLFQRFQQGSPKTHVKYGGSGLGLFICKELARLQGGRIGVSSTRGQGSIFAFYVRGTLCAPAQPDKPQAPPTNGDRKSGPSGANGERHPAPADSAITQQNPPGNITSPIPKDCHILLVEDNLVNQRVMAKQLRQAGFIVTIANHGREALDHLYTTHYFNPNGAPLDIVLMDIEMPVMNGIDCAKEIRKLEKENQVAQAGTVPLIAVTANARLEQQNEAREAGFDTVITKPFRMSALLPELRRFCGT